MKIIQKSVKSQGIFMLLAHVSFQRSVHAHVSAQVAQA